jgi:hypothetical protein
MQRRAEGGGHSFITFRQKFRPESSYLSSHFYNRVRLAETFSNRKARVCGTMRTKGGIPPDLEWEAQHLKTGQSLFWRKGNVIVQVWADTKTIQKDEHDL